MAHRQHWQTGGVTLTRALMTASLLAASMPAAPAMAQGSGDAASGQLPPPARSVLQQGSAPVSLQSLPWVDGAPPRPRAKPKTAKAPANGGAARPAYLVPAPVATESGTPGTLPAGRARTAAQSGAQSGAQPSRQPSARPSLDQQIFDQQASPPQYPAATLTGHQPGSDQPAQPGQAPPGQALPGPAPSNGFQPVEEPVQSWTVGDAQELARAIAGIGSEGLTPADYQPDALQHAIEQGAGPALDEAASRSFDWLAEDLRDGRTPMAARDSWFIVDPDQDLMPTAQLLTQALTAHDVLGSLAPTYPDYAVLKAALAATAPGDETQANAIRINMDRWRWLPRDLGNIYLITNVPEFQVRLTVRGHIIRNYKTIVGKPGRTATPQLAARVQSVVFYPTWTVPQSIIEHEHLADKIAAKPAWAAAKGYKVNTLGDGSISIVQQPGTKNSLGEMKIDMPNPHAIYMHDTDARYLFARPVRAFSHGCVRVEKAVELGMTMAILSKSLTQDRALAIYNSHKNTRVPMAQSFPAYITYFTVGVDVNGHLTRFNDLYDRDAAVLTSFAAPREAHTTQRTSDQEVIVAPDPL